VVAEARSVELLESDSIAPARTSAPRRARRAVEPAKAADRPPQQAFPFAVGAPALPRVQPRVPIPALPAAARRTSGAEIGMVERARTLRRNVVAGLFLLAVGIFHVWTGIEAARVGYALGATQQVTEKLDQQVHELTIELAAATAPARIERAAVRLGLHAPAPGQVVVP